MRYVRAYTGLVLLGVIGLSVAAAAGLTAHAIEQAFELGWEFL